jgi:hypothetical protein
MIHSDAAEDTSIAGDQQNARIVQGLHTMRYRLVAPGKPARLVSLSPGPGRWIRVAPALSGERQMRPYRERKRCANHPDRDTRTALPPEILKL